MKTLTVIFLAGMAFVAASPAFAGRDQTQMMLVQQAIEKKQADNLAQTKKAQAGLAGPTGAPGQVGPATPKSRAGRIDPSAHP